MQKKLSRRDFIKLQAKSGLALAATTSGLLVPTLGTTFGPTLGTALFPTKGFAAVEPDIGVATGGAAAATKAAVDLIGGIQSVVKKGDRVLIKPNMSFARTPEAASNTHPDVVKTVAAMCWDAGASRVMILDHTLSSPKACVKISGIGPACSGIDKDMVKTINSPSLYRQVDIKGAKSLTRTDVAKQALKADVLIAVPKAKSHSATGVSLSMKGMMGLIYDRGTLHRMDLNETIVDLASLLKADLSIIDGSSVLTTGGPGGPGKVVKKDTIIASRDMVAADAYAVAAFEWYGKKFKPHQVKHIRLASERGLGRSDIENLIVKTISI